MEGRLRTCWIMSSRMARAFGSTRGPLMNSCSPNRTCGRHCVKKTGRARQTGRFGESGSSDSRSSYPVSGPPAMSGWGRCLSTFCPVLPPTGISIRCRSSVHQVDRGLYTARHVRAHRVHSGLRRSPIRRARRKSMLRQALAARGAGATLGVTLIQAVFRKTLFGAGLLSCCAIWG